MTLIAVNISLIYDGALTIKMSKMALNAFCDKTLQIMPHSHLHGDLSVKSHARFLQKKNGMYTPHNSHVDPVTAPSHSISRKLSYVAPKGRAFTRRCYCWISVTYELTVNVG